MQKEIRKQNILIVTPNGFSKVNCNKTYESIFRKFEKENLYSLFFRPQDEWIDLDYCQSNFAVSESDIINKILNPNATCGKIITEVDKIENTPKIGTPTSVRGIYSFFKKSPIKNLHFFRDVLLMTDLWHSIALKDWLQEANIGLVFFHAPGYVGAHRLVSILCNALSVPLVVYITDDYVLYNKGGLIHKIYRVFLRKAFRKTVRLATARYCVGDTMQEAYEGYFKQPFRVLMNSTDIKPLGNSSVGKQKVISYFGGLHLDRGAMIVRFAEISGNTAIIRVYTSSEIKEDIRNAFEKKGIVICDVVYDQALSEAIANSDALLHVESNNPEHTGQTMLAVSTKLPEYMVSGKLIIAYGPKTIASMRLLSENKLGVVLDCDENKELLSSKLFAVFQDDEIRKTLINNAYTYVQERFDENKIADKFFNEIKTILSHE
jgi:hypothetical protein